MMAKAESEADPVARSGMPGVQHRITFSARAACRDSVVTWRAQ